MADIDARKFFAMAIGSNENPYAGVFDGNGHTIIIQLASRKYAAPFQYVNGATIKNLTVDGGNAVLEGVYRKESYDYRFYVVFDVPSL